jgi:hypothetical protein
MVSFALPFHLVFKGGVIQALANFEVFGFGWSSGGSKCDRRRESATVCWSNTVALTKAIEIYNAVQIEY